MNETKSVVDFQILEKLLPHCFCTYSPMGFSDPPWNFALDRKIPHGKNYAVGAVTEGCTYGRRDDLQSLRQGEQ